MLALQGRSKNNPCCCYSLISFCPAERDFVTHSASLNLIRNQKILWGRQRRSKKIRSASARTTAPPRIFILPAPERCPLLMKSGFVTGKDLNLFNRCFRLGVENQVVYYKVYKTLIGFFSLSFTQRNKAMSLSGFWQHQQGCRDLILLLNPGTESGRICRP